MTTVYIDQVFLVNFIMDYLTITASGCILGCGNGKAKGIIAAVIGGLYAVFYTLVSDLIILKFVVAGIMVLVFFGYSDIAKFIKRYVIYLMMSALFAGCIVAIYFFTGKALSYNGIYTFNIPLSMVLATAVVVYILTGKVLDKKIKHSGKEIEKLRICFLGNEMEISALIDSGNDLREVISGKKVIVVSKQEICKILPYKIKQVALMQDVTKGLNFLGDIPEKGKFRLVPYCALGTENGMMMAFKPDWVKKANGTKIDCYVGISPQEKLSENYDGLIGTI